jgi:hypothetical protein
MTRSAGTWIGLGGAILGGLVVVAIILPLARPGAGPVASAVATPSEAAGATGPATAAPSAAVTAAPTILPAATVAGPVALIAAGDIASCTSTGDSATAKLVGAMPGTVAVLGDSVYPDGSRSQFNDCYDPAWGPFLDRTRPAPGNHEYRTPDAAGYFAYFGARAGDPADGWYAYDLGAWRVYALNSNCDEIGGCDAGSAQVAWLRADLAADPRQCVLAYWHHPRYSSARHGSQAQTDGLWDALYDAGAEIVLNGHDHVYERFAPQSDAGVLDTGRGMVEFVVGTGGFSHYEFPRVLSTSRVRDGTTFGVLDLTLAAGSWTARFVPIAGRTFTDEASGTCH